MEVMHSSACPSSEGPLDKYVQSHWSIRAGELTLILGQPGGALLTAAATEQASRPDLIPSVLVVACRGEIRELDAGGLQTIRAAGMNADEIVEAVFKQEPPFKGVFVLCSTGPRDCWAPWDLVFDLAISLRLQLARAPETAVVMQAAIPPEYHGSNARVPVDELKQVAMLMGAATQTIPVWAEIPDARPSYTVFRKPGRVPATR